MCSTSRPYSKLFGCNVYGSIRIDEIALKLIDTIEFQRMRDIKQLGMCHYVYPAATHTRFEHSLGVYHLTGRMLEKILYQYPNKEYYIPEFGPDRVKLDCKIIECIKIAGLCHDIGHGPFSHTFDDLLLKNIYHPNKHHEVRSCLIVEMLCKRELKNFSDADISFIKSIIMPNGRIGALYQIVSNSLNGIDVDKFDYLARDTKNLGLGNNFTADRLINEFIIDKNGNIAYPKHCSVDIYEMFHCRYIMHKKVYNHKTCKLIELMLRDLFATLDETFEISKSIFDMEIFCTLTDNSIFNLGKTSSVYKNIVTRNLYKQILKMVGDDAEEQLQKLLKRILERNSRYRVGDFEIIRSEAGFIGGNNKNPFGNIYFYDNKEDENIFILDKDSISGLMSNRMSETHWHLVCNNKEIYQMVMEDVRKIPKAVVQKNMNNVGGYAKL